MNLGNVVHGKKYHSIAYGKSFHRQRWKRGKTVSGVIGLLHEPSYLNKKNLIGFWNVDEWDPSQKCPIDGLRTLVPRLLPIDDLVLDPTVRLKKKLSEISWPHKVIWDNEDYQLTIELYRKRDEAKEETTKHHKRSPEAGIVKKVIEEDATDVIRLDVIPDSPTVVEDIDHEEEVVKECCGFSRKRSKGSLNIIESRGTISRLFFHLFSPYPNLVSVVEYLKLIFPAYVRNFDQITDLIIFASLRTVYPVMSSMLLVLCCLSIGIRWFVSLRHITSNYDFSQVSTLHQAVFFIYIIPFFGVPAYFIYDMFASLFLQNALLHSKYPEYVMNKAEFDSFVEIFVESGPSSVIGAIMFFMSLQRIEPGSSEFKQEVSLIVVSTLVSIANVIKTTLLVLRRSKRNGFSSLDYVYHRIQFSDLQLTPLIPFKGGLEKDSCEHANFASHEFLRSDLKFLQRAIAPVIEATAPTAKSLKTFQFSQFSIERLERDDVFEFGRIFYRRNNLDSTQAQPVKLFVLKSKQSEDFSIHWKLLDKDNSGVIERNEWASGTSFDQLSLNGRKIFKQDLFQNLMFDTTGFASSTFQAKDLLQFAVDEGSEKFMIFILGCGLHLNESKEPTILSESGLDLVTFLLQKQTPEALNLLLTALEYDSELLKRSMEHCIKFKKEQSLGILLQNVALILKPFANILDTGKGESLRASYSSTLKSFILYVFEEIPKIDVLISNTTSAIKEYQSKYSKIEREVEAMQKRFQSNYYSHKDRLAHQLRERQRRIDLRHLKSDIKQKHDQLSSHFEIELKILSELLKDTLPLFKRTFQELSKPDLVNVKTLWRAVDFWDQRNVSPTPPSNQGFSYTNGMSVMACDRSAYDNRRVYSPKVKQHSNLHRHYVGELVECSNNITAGWKRGIVTQVEPTLRVKVKRKWRRSWKHVRSTNEDKHNGAAFSKISSAYRKKRRALFRGFKEEKKQLEEDFEIEIQNVNSTQFWRNSVTRMSPADVEAYDARRVTKAVTKSGTEYEITLAEARNLSILKELYHPGTVNFEYDDSGIVLSGRREGCKIIKVGAEPFTKQKLDILKCGAEAFTLVFQAAFPYEISISQDHDSAAMAKFIHDVSWNTFQMRHFDEEWYECKIREAKERNGEENFLDSKTLQWVKDRCVMIEEETSV